MLCHRPKTGQVESFWLNENRHHNDNIIKSICISGDTIMCGNQRGEVYNYSIKRNKFSLLRKYDNTNILYIFKDSREHWWISVQDQGVFCLGMDSVQFPCSNYIDEIDPGILVLATQKDGLYVYNLNSGQKKHISAAELDVPADKLLSITSFCRDSEYNLWMTTDRQGLLSVDKDWKLRKQHLSHTKVHSDKLYFVAKQNEGRLWVIGAHKLYLFDPKKDQLHTFDNNNGLRLTDMDASSLIDSANRFWILGNTGYVMVDNRNFELNDT